MSSLGRGFFANLREVKKAFQSLATEGVDGIDSVACGCSFSPNPPVFEVPLCGLDRGDELCSLGAQCHHAKQVVKQDVP